MAIAEAWLAAIWVAPFQVEETIFALVAFRTLDIGFASADTSFNVASNTLGAGLIAVARSGIFIQENKILPLKCRLIFQWMIN